MNFSHLQAIPKRMPSLEQNEAFEPRSPHISSHDDDFMRHTNPEDLRMSLLLQTKEVLARQGNLQAYEAIKHAVDFAHERHADQQRDEGTPYILHIDRMLIRLLEDPTIFSPEDLPLALKVTALHDVVEDTPTSPEEIDERFGSEVTSGVMALSREILTEGRKISDEDYYAHLQKQPGYIQTIKVHDRIDNLYSLLNLVLDDSNKDKGIARRVKSLKDTKEHILPLLQNQRLQMKLEKACTAVVQQTPGDGIKHIFN
jgi:(p)ppGpp synthase/HD superfamily hydrolase